jgi:hypothetical protein
LKVRSGSFTRQVPSLEDAIFISIQPAPNPALSDYSHSEAEVRLLCMETRNFSGCLEKICLSDALPRRMRNIPFPGCDENVSGPVIANSLLWAREARKQERGRVECGSTRSGMLSNFKRTLEQSE